MRGRVPAPIAENSSLPALSDELALKLLEFVEIYNYYVECRQAVVGKTRLDEMRSKMDELRDAHIDMTATKEEVNEIWRKLKREMRQAKQSHLL